MLINTDISHKASAQTLQEIKKMYKINFINHFTEEEKAKILEYVKNNIDDLELKKGYNCSIDVSEAVGRTANIDIELKEDSTK